MNKLPYYIYLDSKIIGTAKQITTFFQDQIFSVENTTILIKKYKHKSAKQIATIFNQHKIPYQFVLASDLDALPNGIMFYPFNAQSNCRAVANRKLIHIFITHGESNKAASVKPIIRIYDYIFTAGQAGIDRFLAHNIFMQHDVDNGRIIMAGDTFIGKTGLSQNGKKCIFYAPTWEGGIEQENYSSLMYWQHVAERIILKAQEYQAHTIIIKPHPNTGHRLPEYRDCLLSLAKTCRQQGLQVSVYVPNLPLSFWQKREWKKQKVSFVNSLKAYQAIFAFCDISAMETQLLNEGINYELFYKKHNIGMINTQHYQYTGNSWLTPLYLSEYREYIIDKKFEPISFAERILFLLAKLKYKEFKHE